MFEATFKSLVDRVVEVESLHKGQPTLEVMNSRNWDFVLNDHDSWVVLKVTTNNVGGYGMHPVFCPAGRTESTTTQELLKRDVNLSSAAYFLMSKGEDCWIEPYWQEDVGIRNSEIPLFFRRQHFGRPKGKENYIEFNQLVTHLLGLHWSNDKRAYCVMNELGEEAEEIKIVDLCDVELILIKRKALDRLLYMGKWILLRYYEFSRISENFSDTSIKLDTINLIEEDDWLEIKYYDDNSIDYLKFSGIKIDRLGNYQQGYSYYFNGDQEKKYASFIIKDWKNNQILDEYSIDVIHHPI